MNEGDSKDSLLSVRGYFCSIFRDDEVATLIENNLQPWKGVDNDIMIDRYDGRALLDSKKEFVRLKSYSIDDKMMMEGENDLKLIEQIENERWYYLPQSNSKFSSVQDKLSSENEESSIEEENESNIEISKIHNPSFQYSYEDESKLIIESVSREKKRRNETEIESQSMQRNRNENEIQMESDLNTHEGMQGTAKIETERQKFPQFIPSFEIPSDIELPKSLKQHQLIEKTANYIRKAGLQAEIVLKVRQKNNKSFSFLNEDTPLHNYYQYLKKTGKMHNLPKKEEAAKPRILQGLISSYSSGSENEDDYDNNNKNTYETSLTENKRCKEDLNICSSKNVKEGGNKDVKNEIKQESLVPQTKIHNEHIYISETGTKVVIPPLKIKIIIDKFVSKIKDLGKQFESLVRKKQINGENPLFYFLKPESPYNAYFEFCKESTGNSDFVNNKSSIPRTTDKVNENDWYARKKRKLNQ